jgi:hypothetical protein
MATFVSSFCARIALTTEREPGAWRTSGGGGAASNVPVFIMNKQ